MSGRHWRSFAAIQLGVWTVYGLIHFLAALPAVAPEALGVMAVVKLVRAVTGVAASSLLALLYRRILGLGPGRVATVAVLAATGVSQLWFLVDRALLVSVATAAGLTIDWSWFPRGVELDYVFVLIAWSAGFLVVHYASQSALQQRRALEREVALRDAQLQALSHQLSPHFLFNTLNAIRALVTEDAGRAREMVTRLSKFLNATLAAGQSTSLRDELATVRAYLDIQEARFEDRLDVRIAVTPDAEDCMVPTLLFQPLVENAIQHGSPVPGGPLRVRVGAERAGDTLRIEVSNTGRLASGPDARPERGIGLANVRARLSHFYSTEPRLTLVQEDAWVRVRIEVDHPERCSCAR